MYFFVTSPPTCLTNREPLGRQVVIPPERTAAAVEIQICVRVTLTPAALNLKGQNRSLIPRLIELLGVRPTISCMTENDPKPSPALLENFATLNVSGEDPGDSFRSSLRGYQSIGLGWMLEREKQESGGGAGVRGGLHALWAEYRFDGGGVLYVKDGADGEAAVTRPCASPSPRGVCSQMDCRSQCACLYFLSVFACIHLYVHPYFPLCLHTSISSC